MGELNRILRPGILKRLTIIAAVMIGGAIVLALIIRTAF